MRRRKPEPDAEGWFEKPRLDTESGFEHEPPPMTAGGVVKMLMWVGIVVFAITCCFNVGHVVVAKSHEVGRVRNVAVLELNQTCCRAFYETKPTPPPHEVRECMHILGEDKRAVGGSGANRCERAHDLLKNSFAMQVAAATWKTLVPLGDMSLSEWIASTSIQMITGVVFRKALGQMIPI